MKCEEHRSRKMEFRKWERGERRAKKEMKKKWEREKRDPFKAVVSNLSIDEQCECGE